MAAAKAAALPTQGGLAWLANQKSHAELALHCHWHHHHLGRLDLAAAGLAQAAVLVARRNGVQWRWRRTARHCHGVADPRTPIADPEKKVTKGVKKMLVVG